MYMIYRIYIYIYIEREREINVYIYIERERGKYDVYIYIYIYRGGKPRSPEGSRAGVIKQRPMAPTGKAGSLVPKQ